MSEVSAEECPKPRPSPIAQEIGMRVPTPVERIELPEFAEHQVVVDVKRDDLIHPVIIGNKLRKCLNHLERCRQQNLSTVVTFGGRHSNHILAIAQAGSLLGLTTIGIVRGSDLVGPSAVLEECRRHGMRIVAVDARNYYPVQTLSVSELNRVVSCTEAFYVIPEGGTSEISLESTATLIDEVEAVGRYSHIVCAVGTGGTAAGLAAGLASRNPAVATRVLAIAVVRGYVSLPDQANRALIQKYGEERTARVVSNHLEFEGSAPFGRYGVPKPDVLAELIALQGRIRFPLDSVYTGKTLLQIIRLVRAKRFVPGTRLLFVHTGGYQTAPLRSDSHPRS
jgi:1-aminocyclopropane-1-carboxylate deaminase